jgi:hypothetical protein
MSKRRIDIESNAFRKHVEKKRKTPEKDETPLKQVVGTISRSAYKQPSEICSKIRPLLYASTVVPWPFTYSNGTFLLNHDTDAETVISNLPDLHMTLGECVNSIPQEFAEKGYSIPKIISRLAKETSQGRVFMSETRISDADVISVIKADRISKKTRALWISDNKEKHLVGTQGTHIVISSAYMDGLCSILFSNLVENKISPHFPLCYATGVANVKLKESQSNNHNHNTKSRKSIKKGHNNNDTVYLKKPHQVIWMEYLPYSMCSILDSEQNPELWWSCFTQVFGALAVAQERFGFIHNDLHSENVRVRKVPKDTILYYKTKDGSVMAVPTYGYVFVIIDFGRAFVKPCGNDRVGMISSEFAEGGPCAVYVPDNPTIDIVRLIGSIDDKLPKLVPEKREELRKFFDAACVTETGENILKALFDCNPKHLNYYLDILPRKICKKSNVFDILSVLGNKYVITPQQIPSNVTPFELPIIIK